MIKTLKDYFPMLKERKELLTEIKAKPELWMVYESWNFEQREEFLDFCTGAKGIKILYDSFFKEVLNPEYAPERLESLLCELLKRKVKIVRVLPNDSTRIADETSLLITDIVVELEDGSLANVEIQKIGYSFPDTYFHHSRQVFDSGLKINLLQEFIMIPLDIYKRKMQNESVTTKFDAWLTFLSEDSPERIISLMEK